MLNNYRYLPDEVKQENKQQKYIDKIAWFCAVSISDGKQLYSRKFIKQ
jgi:hypothetical protein